MPKIDWSGDDGEDQPRWEPRPRRERLAREARDRRARLEQIIAVGALPPTMDLPARRPLHLIWGAPIARSAGDAESRGG